MAIGVSACLTIGLAAGCGGGGGADGGTAEYGQKFEKPAATPPPKEKPETQKASKVLSPRERKAKENGG